MIARVVITISPLVYGILPLFMNYSHAEIYNPNWPPFARFHVAWRTISFVLISVFALILNWYPNKNAVRNTRLAGYIGLCILSGYQIASFSAGFYGGALTPLAYFDKGEVVGNTPGYLGIQVVYLLALIGVLVGLVLTFRQGKSGN